MELMLPMKIISKEVIMCGKLLTKGCIEFRVISVQRDTLETSFLHLSRFKINAD